MKGMEGVLKDAARCFQDIALSTQSMAESTREVSMFLAVAAYTHGLCSSIMYTWCIGDRSWKTSAYTAGTAKAMPVSKLGSAIFVVDKKV